MQRMASAIDWSLYVLLDAGLLGERDPLPLARAALSGGATVIQLRAKGWPARRQVALAEALLPLTRAHSAPLLINDHVDIALAVGADGVHLGVDDLPVALARRLMPDGLIGYSPEGVEDGRRGVANGADYLGVGPFAATSTKADAGAAIGPDGIAAIARAVAAPVAAVGGIHAGNAGAAIAAGAAGVVVASAVIGAADVEAAARELREVVTRALAARLTPSRDAR
jgi:thiamine-phosphate diphosphorylase